MNEIIEIRTQLEELAKRESMRLFRLARKAQQHGCTPEVVEAIRGEARELYMTWYPERILTYHWEHTHKYAFKLGGCLK